MDEFVMIGDVEYRVGDQVVVDKDGQETVGMIDELDIGADNGVISLDTGGWFHDKTGWMNIHAAGWRIVRKATQKDIATLDIY